jgi:thiosulfate/3-mercaptopyruvate sulfurtransferase
LREIDQMTANVNSKVEQVVDARSQARFDGTTPEPREGLRRGHIPGSVCLPYTELLTEQKTMKPAESLRASFEQLGIDLKEPIVTTCGSGISASFLALALHLIGHQSASVYDGSWSEWGLREDLPIES